MTVLHIHSTDAPSIAEALQTYMESNHLDPHKLMVKDMMEQQPFLEDFLESRKGSALLQLMLCTFITPHAQRERGKVIDRGVHIIYIYVCSQKKI